MSRYVLKRSDEELSSGARRSNRWPNAFGLLFGDLLAFGAASAMGGLIAYGLASYLLGVQYFAFEGTNLIHQLVVLAGIATGLCAWFALRGHYTERRLFITDLGEILSASLVGLLINGFIDFANKANFSRLWIMTAWLLAAVFVPVARIAARKALNAYGMWMVNAVIIGEGYHRAKVKDHFQNIFMLVTELSQMALLLTRRTTRA